MLMVATVRKVSVDSFNCGHHLANESVNNLSIRSTSVIYLSDYIIKPKM